MSDATDTGGPLRPRSDDHMRGVLLCWVILLGLYAVIYVFLAFESAEYATGPSLLSGLPDGLLQLAVSGFFMILITGAGLLFVGLPLSLLVERLLRPLNAITATTMTIRVLVYLAAGWLAGAVIIPAILLLLFSGVSGLSGIGEALGWTSAFVGAPAALAAATARLSIDVRVRRRARRAGYVHL